MFYRVGLPGQISKGVKRNILYQKVAVGMKIILPKTVTEEGLKVIKAREEITIQQVS